MNFKEIAESIVKKEVDFNFSLTSPYMLYKIDLDSLKFGEENNNGLVFFVFNEDNQKCYGLVIIRFDISGDIIETGRCSFFCDSGSDQYDDFLKTLVFNTDIQKIKFMEFDNLKNIIAFYGEKSKQRFFIPGRNYGMKFINLIKTLSISD